MKRIQRELVFKFRTGDLVCEKYQNRDEKTASG